MKTKNHWAEIRTDYEDDFFRRVDAWKTDDDNEEGEVIAQVDMLTGRIVYINLLARIDEAAQEAIRSLVDEAKKEHPYQSPSPETDKHPLPPETEKLISTLTAYAKQYREPPYGREIDGTSELLEQAASALKEALNGIAGMKNRYMDGMLVHYQGDDADDGIECPVCGYEVAQNDDYNNTKPKHCPECGTKLIY